MRWLNMGIVVVLAAAMLIFAIQNLQSVTVSFLNLTIGAPLAVLAVVLYLLGMATGSSLWALIRWALEGSKRPAAT
jgi:putative membrane protein